MLAFRHQLVSIILRILGHTSSYLIVTRKATHVNFQYISIIIWMGNMFKVNTLIATICKQR